MRGRALALTTMSAILLAGCETTSVTTETPSVSTSTTAMLDKPEGGERWLCRDRWDRDESGAIELVAVRAGDATQANHPVTKASRADRQVFPYPMDLKGISCL